MLDGILDTFWEAIASLLTPFYSAGIAIWNGMLSMIGMVSVNTPETFSEGTWTYVTDTMYPWALSIGAMMLNIFFFIGIIRQTSNLKQNFTLEIFVECCIKVVFGNALMLSGLELMKSFFSMASGICGSLMLETPELFVQNDTDLGSVLFYMLFGFIFLIVCMVCSVMIFLVVYGRFLQLYLLVISGPIAWGTIPGGPGISQTAVAWLRTFLAKVFEVVMIVIAIILAGKFCNSIDFGTMSGIGGIFDGAIQALQNICTMVLLTASVKGMDGFMKRVYAL